MQNLADTIRNSERCIRCGVQAQEEWRIQRDACARFVRAQKYGEWTIPLPLVFGWVDTRGCMVLADKLLKEKE